MSKNNVIKNVSVDKKFIKALVSEHGYVGAIKCIKNIFGDGMVQDINHDCLRVSVWQLTHSINRLEELSNKSFSSIVEIKHLANISDDITIKTIANHIICGVDQLNEHII